MGYGKPDYIETRLFINGEFVNAKSGKTFEVKSPYSHQKTADVQEASVEDVDAAVAAAKAAFPAWSDLTPPERGAPMKRLSELIAKHNEELASLEALSMGKPVSSFFDGHAAVHNFAHYAEAGYDAKGKTSLNTTNMVTMTWRQPFGVAAAIIPWNLPLLFFSEKVAAALAAGCTIVIKSSEKAPLTSLKVAELIRQAGFPKGVVNVLSGYGNPSGAALSAHPDVRVITFVGSLPTGKKIQEAASKSNLKRVVLELGGKSPLLVFDDADMDKAAQRAQMSIGQQAGQACFASSRVYVQETCADKFIEAYKKVFKESMKIGDPLDPNTTQGPQADEPQYERVKGFLQLGRDATDGTKVAMGGNMQQHDGKGFFTEPTIFTGVPENARLLKEEIFGPVVAINTFKTEEEALAKANDTEYGLYSSVFTKDISRALRIAKSMESGQIGINCSSPTYAPDMPFGGYKQSGQGREGIGYSMENYLEEKAVYIQLN
ncbi:MAG: hypothetical protein Q9162_005267 [Coniocarpon cinnabarinum]